MCVTAANVSRTPGVFLASVKGLAFVVAKNREHFQSAIPARIAMPASLSHGPFVVPVHHITPFEHFPDSRAGTRVVGSQQAALLSSRLAVAPLAASSSKQAGQGQIPSLSLSTHSLCHVEQQVCPSSIFTGSHVIVFLLQIPASLKSSHQLLKWMASQQRTTLILNTRVVPLLRPTLSLHVRLSALPFRTL